MQLTTPTKVLNLGAKFRAHQQGDSQSNRTAVGVFEKTCQWTEPRVHSYKGLWAVSLPLAIVTAGS